MIDSAARLIAEGEKVGTAARLSGFESRATFNRHFKRIVGCTPRDFRAEHGRDPADGRFIGAYFEHENVQYLHGVDFRSASAPPESAATPAPPHVPYMTALSHHLLRYRVRTGRTQEQVAASLNRDAHQSGAIERGERLPSRALFAAIVDLIGIGYDEARRLEEEIFPPRMVHAPRGRVSAPPCFLPETGGGGRPFPAPGAEAPVGDLQSVSALVRRDDTFVLQDDTFGRTDSELAAAIASHRRNSGVPSSNARIREECTSECFDAP
jgi:hypothetical protein